MDAANVRKLGFGGYTLDPLNGRLTLHGAEVALRPKAFEVLCLLVEAAPDLVPKERLIDTVWPNVVVGDDSLVQCVRDIRIALHDDDQTIIRTVPRRGYLFTRPVHEPLDALRRPSDPPGPRSGDAPATAVLPGAAPLPVRRWIAAAAAVVVSVAAVVTALPHGPLRPTLERWFAKDEPASTAVLTMAVLPPRNLGGGVDQDYLAEALTADLTTDLARLPNSMVTARASAARYRDQAADTRQVGAELGVRYLLQGSLRRLDDDLRLNLQLIEAGTGKEIWTDRFEARRDQLAALQRQVTTSLTRTLHVRLADVESQRRLHEHVGQPLADDLALRGWYLWQQNRPETVAQARELLLKAVALEPGHAYAWACLNFTYISDLSNNWIDLRSGPTWAGWLQRADEAATQAYRLDPNLPAAIAARAATLALQGKPEESIVLREQQIAMTPNDPIAHHNLATLKLFTDHPDQVLAHEQQAMRVSPRDPKLFQMMGIVALAELHMRHDVSALQWAERAVAVNPDYVGGHGYVASAAAHLDDLARARAALAELGRLRPNYRIRTFRDEFDRYSDRPTYRAGQEHYYDGLRKAGLAD